MGLKDFITVIADRKPIVGKEELAKYKENVWVAMISSFLITSMIIDRWADKIIRKVVVWQW